jgi:hypothetical protein
MKLSSFKDVELLTLTMAVITVDLSLPPLGPLLPLPLAGRILTSSSISSPNLGTLAIYFSSYFIHIGQWNLRKRKNESKPMVEFWI